ncbi:Holliday junction resolvase RuvX [Fictibacillus phosphorivorans]|uniref:Holliday junction resolvase RuvX n=1 Tax=Fictibacillus phosphorivorans TaxID=1221500 RepID=UPI00203F9D7F|nr:Holliday junction resolvase RuvX [Fictibacillus phosphorivorans]MCM3716960.1 Holliday junction resolvase RuvX [Fictibacillus phosphorivorans]MCM3774491.1 Holliday junction resolvase RuvX [Fictibacillus phosphorivorans]
MTRILGLDVGTKTIGVAVSDLLGWTAQGVETIRRRPNHPEEDLKRIQELISEYEIGTVVIGLPKNMNGSIGPSGEACQNFAKEIESLTGLSVILWDERLTTMAAERTLISADVSRKKRKQVIDKLAAVIILQGYMDSQKNKN